MIAASRAGVWRFALGILLFFQLADFDDTL